MTVYCLLPLCMCSTEMASLCVSAC